MAQKQFDKMDEIEKPEDGKPEKKEVTVSQERKSHAKAERTKDPMATWIQQKLYAGYTLKPHTLPTGEITRSLMRGPFIPVSPARDMINCFSMTGEDLGLIDSETGIEDISYKMAWHLGRSLAMADRSFTAALLRFRGHVHAEAVQRVKARRAVTMKVNGTDTGDLTLAACFGSLHESVNQLQKAHDITNLTGGDSRWLRKREDRQSGVLARLAVSGAPLDLEEGTYIEELEAVVNAFFGFPPPHTEAKPEIPPISQRAIDSDAVLVRAWALDKFFLAGFPLHNLVPDPDMLPRESIRTFCIDPKWVDSVIDGGLSMANHFANGDDVIRRAIKSCLNRYMAEVRSDGPGKGTTVQMPKWGFLLRSIAVTAFPDLKVEAKFSEEVPEGIREVLYMQLLAEDILLCLFDRKPGEDNFNKICISQPSHQQSFEAGESLTKSTLKGWFRPIPLVPLSSEVGEERKSWNECLLPQQEVALILFTTGRQE
ncbi:hypothetical protein TrVFT333_006170 [Trichoderma virens FT-333]|nr:hypothetical protein TrVFT333_006170 [Trichoderma virens FT-333]